MNKEEARKLLDAWSFIEKNPKAKWEGFSLKELEDLIKEITGEDNPAFAKAYLEKVAAGQISETVPQKLIDKVRSGEIPEAKLKRTEATISATRDWINRLEAKNAEEIAAKQVAAAKAKALIEKAKKKEAPPAPEALAPVTPPPPTPEVVIPAPEAPKISVPVSVERGIKGRILTTRDQILFLPFRAVVAVAGPTLAKENPELATQAYGLSHGWTTPQAAAWVEQSALASGNSPSQIKKFFSVMQSLPAPLAFRIASGRSTWADLSYASFIDRRFSPAQLAAFVPSSDGSIIVLPGQSFVGGIFTQIGQRLLGRTTTSLLKSLLGGAGKAAVGVGAKAAGAAAGTAAGGAAIAEVGIGAAVGGPLGAAIGAITSFLTSKIPDLISWLKRHAKDFGVAAFALIVGGIFLNNFFLVGLGGGLGVVSLTAGGAGAISQGASGFLQALYVGLTALVLPSLAVPLIVAFVTLPVLIAIILFIINTSAFVLPKQVGPNVPINPAVANLPANIRPNGWPIAGPIIQGPETSGTHAGAEAVDIIAVLGTPIKTTVAGVAHVLNSIYYGKEVEVTFTYTDATITVRFAHLSVVSVKEGQQVLPGDTLGLSGNTGNSSQPHLHYEFKGLPLAPPFIPNAVSYGCEGIADCNQVVQ